MKKEKQNYIKLGLFVIAAIILFTIGAYNIGSKKNLFGSNFTISALFNNVKGLQTGNVVRFSGINVGSIDNIMIINDSTIQVDMRIQSSLKHHIKTDALAYIGTLSLVGDVVLNIVPGKSSGGKIKSGDFIGTMDRVETDDLFSSLDQTSKNVILLTENLVDITAKINEGEGLIPELLTNKSLAVNLDNTAKNLNEISSTLAITTNELRAAVDGISRGKGILGYLLTDSSFAQKADLLLNNLDTQFFHKTNPILNSLDASSANVENFSKRIDSLVAEIDLREGMLGLLLKDSTITDQSHNLLSNALTGTDSFNENMEALKHNFLFRRYFKKQARKKEKALKEQQKLQEAKGVLSK